MTDLEYLKNLLAMERGILREMSRVVRNMADGNDTQINDVKKCIAQVEQFIKEG